MKGSDADPGLGLPEPAAAGPVECLGLTFDSDHARYAHFTDILREKLRDPVFRATPGFPAGTDEAILRMSDPPYYTACPNPFIEDFVRAHGRPYDATESYARVPFAVDVSVGKTDGLYKAHGYHTKVPHLAIVPSILHYTAPGDIVLDGFCGSGMTGLAAQWCGAAPRDYQLQLEAEWKANGSSKPQWGPRRAVLGDLGPAASFIAAGYNLPFDVALFEHEAERIMRELESEIGWMYACTHTDGRTKGRINYVVWSEVFSCPQCAGEINFIAEALDDATNKTRAEFLCPHCDKELTKKRLERLYVTTHDRATGGTLKAPKRAPVLLNYNVGGETYERPFTREDGLVLARVEALTLPPEVPMGQLPYMHMTHERARMDAAGVTHLHHFFLPRAAHALAALWRRAQAVLEPGSRRMMVWFAEQAIWSMSLLNRYRPTGYSQVSQYLSGVYYVPSQSAELSPWYVLFDVNKRTTKVSRLTQCFAPMPSIRAGAVLQVSDCRASNLPSNSVDYVFTDPPFGENIYYADLNFLVEAWHRVSTDASTEAIVDQAKEKGLHDYQELMKRCFAEYYRVLKPGRWMTVVFSNSSSGVWRAIQEAMGSAGFVVADVRTLDKQQGSYRQVTSTAMKQDLVISAYRPTDALERRFEVGHASAESAWEFVREHLRNVPVIVGNADDSEIVAERTQQMLHDRMIGFHVQRGLGVPLSSAEFLTGLERQFPCRDGMYFLPEQVVEFDRKRTGVNELRQLVLFVFDEQTAIHWVRQQLQDKPQTFQELTPQYLQQTQRWARHETPVELKTILEQGFFVYEGTEPVPSQIHRYLSSNYKDLRNLEKDAPRLIEKALGRWYVPDPKKQVERDTLREKALLREFEEYRSTTQRKIKIFRTEAIRAGFKACWQERDYATIIRIAEKLPDDVLQEDGTLLMYYDNALTRRGTD